MPNDRSDRRTDARDWLAIGLIFSPVWIFLVTVYGMAVAHADASSFPAWLEAVATTFAFAAAATAAWYAKEAFVTESRREKTLNDSLLSESVKGFSAWIEEAGWLEENPGTPSSLDQLATVVVKTSNSGGVSVFDVQVEVWFQPADRRPGWKVGSGELASMPPGVGPIPAKVVLIEPDRVIHRSEMDDVGTNDLPGRLRVYYTIEDSTGHRWRRDADGFNLIEDDRVV